MPRWKSGGPSATDMRSKTVISDEVYHRELERLHLLPKFPEVPIGQQELIRVLRRITETDGKFLHELVTGFVDTAEACPRPTDLYERANAMRADAAAKPLGNPSCMKCHGAGWVHTTKRVKIAGLDPYEAESSERCMCTPPKGNS